MSGQIIELHSGSEPGRLIRLLQDELTATNREVLAMTVELDERVKERTNQFLQANQKLTQEIAERKHAEEEVRKLNQDLADRAVLLEEANHELEAFSYSVSHDLRAPLRHVIGFASILKEQGKATLDQEAQGLIECICEAANRMSTLIDALLRFSRLARVQVSAGLLDLNELATEVISEFEQEVEGRNIIWKRAQLPGVHADPELLHQVFVNLISNALKYSRGRDPAEIEIGFREEQEACIFFVRDNGAGFDPRYTDKLFGVFQRLHTEEEFEGTGIGLANVRQIVTRHGGKTWAEGTLGKGATFYFSLPRVVS